MLVTILPFFLAAHVAVDDPRRQSEWAMYGAECTYDVLVMMSLANISQANDNFCSTIASELKCRPKGQDTLSCHFQNSRIRHPGPEEGKCTNAMDFVPTRTRFVDEEPFEIRFNPSGVENLVVHRTISRWQLDMIKVIVSQLNMGFKTVALAWERRDRFSIMENSTMGHCEVDVKISYGDFDYEDNDDDRDDHHNDHHDTEEHVSSEEKKEGEDFEIELSLSANDKIGHTFGHNKFHVQKLRQPKSCPRRTIYFFGNEEDYSHGDKEIYMDMTDSVSHITITKNKFISLSVEAGVMKTENKSQVMRPQQVISLKLKRIDLARNPLPDIQNPASTSLFAFSTPEAIPENA